MGAVCRNTRRFIDLIDKFVVRTYLNVMYALWNCEKGHNREEQQKCFISKPHLLSQTVSTQTAMHCKIRCHKQMKKMIILTNITSFYPTENNHLYLFNIIEPRLRHYKLHKPIWPY